MARIQAAYASHCRSGDPLNTVIIHLGTHKAASTSVQLFLAHNRVRLRELGICYPEAPPPTPFAHHALAWSIISQYTQVARRPGNYSLNDALADFAHSGCHTLMLSSEDFLTCTPYEGFLESFFERLRTTFQRVVLCAYVRDRKGFFTSSYNMWIKSLVYTGDFDSYLQQALSGNQAPMHYTRSLARWAELADDTVFLALRPDTFALPVEQQLLLSLGISDEAVDSLQPYSNDAQNASIGPMALLAYRCTMELLQRTRWYETYDLGRREHLTHFLHTEVESRNWNLERSSLFTRESLDAVHARCLAEDNRFARTFWEASDWGDVFPHETALYPVNELSYPGLAAQPRRAIDEVVSRSLAKARELYDIPDNQQDTLQERLYRLSRSRSARW